MYSGRRYSPIKYNIQDGQFLCMSSERGADVKTMLEILQSHAPFDRLEGMFGMSRREQELTKELQEAKEQIRELIERVNSQSKQIEH